MNFLFLTTMMILIFMLTSLSMTGTLKTTAGVTRGLDNFITSKYAHDNSNAKKKYYSSKRSKRKTDKGREKDRTGKVYTPRNIKPCAGSKLNLYPLVGGNYNQSEKKLLLNTLKG